MAAADKVQIIGADGNAATVNSSGKLAVDATLSTGDIEIGAVEIKNGTTDTRATVLAASAAAQATDTALVVAISPNNAVTTTPTTSTTGSPTSVASSLTAVTVLASNATRKGAAVYYDAAAILYVLAGTGTVSSSLYTLKMGAGFYTYYEVPASYTGVISGIWSVATGSALVTEYT